MQWWVVSGHSLKQSFICMIHTGVRDTDHVLCAEINLKVRAIFLLRAMFSYYFIYRNYYTDTIINAQSF